jgi:hypothetical protein
MYSNFFWLQIHHFCKKNTSFFNLWLTLHCLCATLSYVAFSIDDASSTKPKCEIGNDSEFHYLGISCFLYLLFHQLLQFFPSSLVLALFFPPCWERHPQIWGRSLWEQCSEPKCCQLLWVPVLFCVPASSLCKLPCRKKGTHWWRHYCVEGSGVVWSLTSEFAAVPQASLKNLRLTLSLRPFHACCLLIDCSFYLRFGEQSRFISMSNRRAIFTRCWQ